MILSTLSHSDRYASLHDLFPLAFEYIRNTDLYSMPPGRYPVFDNKLLVIVECVSGRTRESAKLECHRRHIDIQLVLEGDEEMGWRALSECNQPVADYNAQKDLQFFHDTTASWVATPPGSFCIFFPEDAHAPLVGSGNIRKVIIKVPV
jgi:biofilm protein TabA